MFYLYIYFHQRYKKCMKLGLVCISEMLKLEEKVHSKTMTRKKFLSEEKTSSLVDLSNRILDNTRVLKKTIEMCSRNGISHLRVSSSMFPLVTDETLGLEYSDLPDMTSIIQELNSCGELARNLNISLSCHPSQFNVLSSLNPDVVRRTIRELNHESQVMDWLGCDSDYSSPMCLHLSRSPKSETDEEYRDLFCEAFSKCSQGVKNRLVLENEDKGYWSCENLYNVFKGVAPFVYDNLHDQCNPSSLNCSEHWASLFKETWGNHTPVFHWSEGIDGTRKHTDYFTHIPNVVESNDDVTWECEVKAKDLAICKVLNQVDCGLLTV